MREFNNMTLVAAAEVLSFSNSHSALGLLELEWGIHGRCSQKSIYARISDLARIAIEENVVVVTTEGPMSLERALIARALSSPPGNRERPEWIKLVTGLRLDGFDAAEEMEDLPRRYPWDNHGKSNRFVLRRMLPEEVPGMDFREMQSALSMALVRHGFTVAKGHLDQAISAFSRGEWAAANAQLRTFLQDLLDQIAVRLGCDEACSDDTKREYLASPPSGPFFLTQYNEWVNDRGRPAFVLGLWARLHPQGSHPGLSEEDDCTFRLQVTLITARLFLRRLDQRASAP